MALQEQLLSDLQQSMRDKDDRRRSTLRMVRSAVKNVEIAKRKPLGDEDVLTVLQKEAKQRRESIEEYKKANRPDLVQVEQEELAIIESYLPKQMSAEEVREVAHQVIAEVGAAGPKDIGKVMPVIMARVQGRADGRTVSQAVREELEANS
jgi:uncharacterized protein